MAGESTSTGKRVGANLFWTLFSVFGEKVVFLLVTIYLARVLGVETFGMFTAGQVLTMNFWIVVDVGISSYGVREIARDRQNAGDVIRQLMGMRLASGVTVLIIYGIIVWYVSGLSYTQRLLMLSCGLYLVTNALYADWVFRGLEQFKYITYGSFATSAFFFISCLLLVKGEQDAYLAALVWSLSYLLGSTVLLVVLGRMGYRVAPSADTAKWWGHLKESVYFVMSGGSMALFALLPILILTRYASSYALGIFSAPYRIVQSIAKAGTLVEASFYPVLAESYHVDWKRFLVVHKKFRATMLAMGIPVAALGMIFGDRIALLLLGEKYAGSGLVFKVLMVVVALRYLRYSYDGTMMATGFQRLKTATTIVALISLLICFWLLSWGNQSVAMAEAIIAADGVYLAALIVGAEWTFLRRRVV